KGKQRWRYREANRLGGLEVDHQLELSRLLDRQIAGLSALENLVDEKSLATEDVVIVRRIGHQPSGDDTLVVGVHRWQSVLDHLFCDACSLAGQKRIGHDEQGIGTYAVQHHECIVKAAR